ncbi:MAG: archease [DPANN group archaeon]|nr:archease [DPANN group archaeon]
MKKYELLEGITADVGIKATADTFPELLEMCAQAMFEIMYKTDNVDMIEEKTVEIDVRNNNEETLHAFLGELLFIFQTEYIIFKDFKVQIQNGKVTCVAKGEKAKEGKHEYNIEIKAVTYHELKVEKTDRGYTATVIFDI